MIVHPPYPQTEIPWSWLGSSIIRGAAAASLAGLIENFSSPHLAAGCLLLNGAIVYFNNEEMGGMVRDFRSSSGITKVLMVGIPILLGSLARVILPHGNLLNVSLTLFAALSPLFKKEDDEIDLFFLQRSRRYRLLYVENESQKILLQAAYAKIAEQAGAPIIQELN